MTFHDPSHECDVVMKGGITSGVVYPKAILQIAKKYRLKRLGGTSAGAIAAAFAAAAELDRKGGGFERLAEIPAELSEHLVDLFQPAPRHRKAFRRALRLYDRAKKQKSTLVSFLLGAWGLRSFWKSMQSLPSTFYGLCPGSTQPKGPGDGLTDWLEKKLEYLAGRGDGESLPDLPPLCFGDLEDADITFRAVTTDLSAKNPVLMPFGTRTWMFRESEMRQLFSARVVDHLTKTGRRYDPAADGGAAIPGLADDLYSFPATRDLPILLAVRLSLSFPVLLAAIPLYRRDFELVDPVEKQTPRCCWMSDGGVASNFPIHLFDSPLPRRPTFGFSLDAFDPARQRTHEGKAPSRVRLILRAGSGILRPIDRIEGLLGFAAAILNTARNWQDGLQATLPGYRERIVHIALDHDEGGLNLNMDPALITALGDYGDEAGQAIVEQFPFEDHQWRRLLSTYGAFEEYLGEMAATYPSFKALQAVEPTSYKAPKANVVELWHRMDELVALGEVWNQAPLRDTFRGAKTGTPRPRAYLKLVPREQAGVTTGTQRADYDEDEASS